MKDNNEYPEKGAKTTDERALKYANDFIFPVKVVEYGYSYLQELKAQRDVIKDAYIAGAKDNLQPANNDYAVKESQWISVDDRLPLVDTDVFVLVQMNGFIDVQKDKFRLLDSYGEVKNWFHHYNVTHWMPMPALPSPPTIKPIKK